MSNPIRQSICSQLHYLPIKTSKVVDRLEGLIGVRKKRPVDGRVGGNREYRQKLFIIRVDRHERDVYRWLDTFRWDH